MVRRMHSIWPLLDLEDLDGSFDRWLTTAAPLIRANRATSATLAASYVKAYRAAELGVTRPPPVVLADVVSSRALATSLLVTGPVQLKRALRNGMAPARAASMAEATSAAAAMRHVLNGGRETILEMTRADRRALGWARAASGRACAFCAMLASRGPVYGEAGGDFKAHDHCGCTAEPVYRDDSAWPSGSDRYAQLWQQARADEGDTLANFRRLVAA